MKTPLRINVLAVGLGSALLVSAILFLLWFNRPPTYTFDFSAVSDPDDISELYSLARQVERLEHWTPEFAKYGPVLNALIENSLKEGTGFPTEGSWDDLMITSDFDDPRVASYNQAILKLSELTNDVGFRMVQRMDSSNSEKWLNDKLEEIAANERRAALELVLEKKMLDRLHSKYSLPPFPRNGGYQKIWTKGFVDSVHSDLDSVIKLYDSIGAAQFFAVPHEDKVPGYFRPQSRSEGGGWIHHDRFDSTVDLELWHKESFDELKLDVNVKGRADESVRSKTSVNNDTGIRVSKILIKVDVNNGSGYDEEANEAMLLKWPPEGLYINTQRFKGFLGRLGLPSGFMLKDVTPDVNWRSGPDFLVKILLSHSQVDTFTAQYELRFSLLKEPPVSLRSQIKGIRTKLEKQLKDELAALRLFSGFPCEIVINDEKNGRHGYYVNFSGSDKIRMALSIDESGNIGMYDDLGIRERQRLASYICSRIPELRALEQWSDVRAVRMNGSLQQLQGVLSFSEGSGLPIPVKGKPPEFKWSLDPTGKVELVLSQESRQWIGDVATAAVKNQIPSPSQVESSEAVEEQALKYLRTKYPLLKEDLEVARVVETDEGNWVSLGLRIHTWPSLRLGPILCKGGNLNSQLDRLLLEASVIKSAGKQWVLGDSGAEPLSKFTLESWSPKLAHAGGKSQLNIPGIGFFLNWKDEVRVENGRWVRRSADICQQLEPQLATLEKEISKVISQSLDIDLDLNVERDRYGPSQWMRLHPFGMELRAKASIPLIYTNIGVGTVVIDRDGIHPPQKISVGIRSSFPVPPHVTISDPEITFDFERAELGVDAKFTPIAIPGTEFSQDGTAQLSDSQTSALLEGYGIPNMPVGRLRPDNPWLHVAYLRAGIFGSFQQKEVGLTATFRVLDSADVASGTGRFNWEKVSLNLEAKSQPAPQYENFPSLDGELSIERGKGLSMEGQFDCWGHQINAGFSADTSTAPLQLTTYGFVTLPIAGRIRLDGKADFDFSKYRITAKGAAPIPSMPNLRYQIIADEKDFNIQYWWDKHSGGKAGIGFSSPSAKLIDYKKIETSVEEAVAKSLSGDAHHDLSEEGKVVFSKHAPTSEQPEFDLPHLITLEGLDNPPMPNSQELNEKRASIVGKLEIQVNFGFLDVKSISSGEIFLHLKLSQLSSGLQIKQEEIDNREKTFYLIRDRKDWWQLLVFDNFNKQTYRVLCPSRDVVGNVEAIMYGEFGLDPMYLPTESKERLLNLPPLFNQLVFGDTEFLTLSGYEVDNPVTVKDGVLIKFKEAQHRWQWFRWVSEIGGRATYCGLNVYGANGNAEFFNLELCEAISTWEPPSPLLYFITQSPIDSRVSKPRVAMLNYDAKRNISSATLYMGTLDSLKAVPIQFVKSSIDVRDLLAAVVQANWRGELEIDEATIYVGGAGIVVAEEKSIGLLSKARLREQEGQLSLIVLTREQIAQWQSDSDRLLPRKYRTEKVRRTIDLKHWAAEAIKPWSGNRKTKDGWQASPIGLLESLGTKP